MQMQDDHMQIIKGKRKKRQRLPSPIRLTMSTCSSLGRSRSNNSVGFDLPPTSDDELRNEEEDMADCLILLAQGHSIAKPSHKKSGLYLFGCKTCDRCFPSFQALGGHRSASHKKYSEASAEEKQGVTTFANELVDNSNSNHDSYCDPTSTTLTLRSSTALYNHSSSSSRSTSTINAKSKVHECSICRAGFSSGQALGGHMRRHRNFLSASMSGTIANGGEIPETKKHKDVLNLDLNLPAPEDDHKRESKLITFQSKEQVIVFSAISLVDCHY